MKSFIVPNWKQQFLGLFLQENDYKSSNLFSQKLSTLTIAKFITSTRTAITLQSSVKKSGGITMCFAFTPDCRYDQSIIKLNENVHCPNTIWSDMFCVHENTFQSLATRDYQGHPWEFMCQLRNIPVEDQTFLFFVKFGQFFGFLKRRENQFKMFLRDVFCPTCPNQKCFYLSANKNSSFYDGNNCKTCSYALICPFTDQNPTFMLFGVNGANWFRKTLSRDFEKGNPSQFPMTLVRHSQSSTPQREPKKAKIILFVAYSRRNPIGWYS